MVACPELVDLKSLGKKTFPTQPAPAVGTALTPVDWVARHPEMVVGVPQKGTPEKGRKLARIWANAVVEHLRMIKKDKICPSVMASYVKRAHSIRKRKARRK